ncbi:MAG: type IV toxin-antitoxin system AbiEi family antitoxin domain-containing protein [Anaerolineales bacterium]|nr:type IV toxin-antitoxin system AbiEi family antitoxin domain-containing protein [Anaerolineales bacterium]
MTLSAGEYELLSRLAAKGKTIFSTSEAQELWGGSTPIKTVLHRLEKKGWLQRAERGVYLLIPLEAGPERTWSESPLVIAPYLIQPAAVAYWSALHYWQMTEQIPRITIVQSTKRKLPVEVQGMRFQFVTVKEARFFGVLERTLNSKKFYVTDREKTLVDCADRPDLGGGILLLAQALRTAQTEIEWSKLDAYLMRWEGGTVVKRLGYLVDRLQILIPEREPRLAEWQKMISRGISPLEPGAGRSGPVVTRWGLRINVDALSVKAPG